MVVSDVEVVCFSKARENWACNDASARGLETSGEPDAGAVQEIVESAGKAGGSVRENVVENVGTDNWAGAIAGARNVQVLEKAVVVEDGGVNWEIEENGAVVGAANKDEKGNRDGGSKATDGTQLESAVALFAALALPEETGNAGGTVAAVSTRITCNGAIDDGI